MSDIVRRALNWKEPTYADKRRWRGIIKRLDDGQISVIVRRMLIGGIQIRAYSTVRGFRFQKTYYISDTSLQSSQIDLIDSETEQIITSMVQEIEERKQQEVKRILGIEAQS